MPRIKHKSMHLSGPIEGEAFMKRQGINPEGDDKTEWLDNENGYDPNGILECDEIPESNPEADEDGLEGYE